MLTRCLFLFFLLFAPALNLLANDYENAWKALDQNDRKKALSLLKHAMNDPATAVDAYITYVYIKTFEGQDDKIHDYISEAYENLPDPNAYVYAMWFNRAVLGEYGKKTSTQQKLLAKILADKRINGSVKAAAYYVKSLHYQFSNDITSALNECGKIGAAGPLWQLAGPFDNLSGSGFFKNFGPLEQPGPTARFTSLNNAEIAWFTPPVMNQNGWTYPFPHIRYNTASVYAQTFVNAPSDMKVLLNAGCSGAIKVWVNDEVAIAEPKEIVTELDYYKNYVQLKKGYNRLLVQLSYTNSSFPNFIVRLTDDNYNSIKGLEYNSVFRDYPKLNKGKQPTSSIKHFAEAFFENKIKREPDNIINYILLSQTYLRNMKTADARSLIEKAVERFPDNMLLRFELMQCYLKEANRTSLLQEMERMKERDPDCMLAFRLNIEQLMDQEKYYETEAELKRYDSLYNNDGQLTDIKVKLYGAQNKMDDLIKTIEDMYKTNPDNPQAAQMMFNVKMKVHKDVKGALGIYEHFLKTNYSYDIIKMLANEYNKQGIAEKELQWLKYLADNFSYDPELYTNISNYYFNQQEYDKASEFGRKALELAPYVATYWENLGVELQQQNINGEAANAYQKALYYDGRKYDARARLRELQNKPSIWKAFPETDVYELIKKADNSIIDYDFYYLLDEKFAVVYPEGTSEEYYTLVINVLNQKGIDTWKETDISYNSNSSVLSVEKAETVKKNGVKTPAERNGNQLVFTGLEAGDALVLKYKIQNYTEGRLAKEYWNKFIFNAFVPEKISRFCLLIANNIKFNHKTLNTSISPRVSTYDDFTLYTWQKDSSIALKTEPYMPTLGDVGESVTVSTIASWKDIANWYSDLSALKTDDDYEVRRVFGELFPKGVAALSQKNIARIIYDYITKNIRYSSVAFRQSAYVPQKPSVTINTSLGDCKDLSALFVSLTKLAGIKANLVLVNTRDYGQNSMALPSVEFNHCIVKCWLEGDPYYIELTDSDLPFASLPSSLYQATCLVIPSGSKDTISADLGQITAINRTKEKLKRKAIINIVGNDISLKVNVTKTGTLTSAPRNQFAMLSVEKQREEMEKNISGRYKNPVKVSSVSFSGLDEKIDSVHYSCDYTIQNEVSELGDIQMIKIPFEDMVATIDNFSLIQRRFPVEYWKYEDVDEYETTIDIIAPDGTHFIELPKDEKFIFPGGAYALQYMRKGPGRLTIIRKASLKRDNIPAAGYAGMKDFLNKIVKAESKYIAFKK
jgi:tetratricopeptide (TPR) repeat protein